VFYGPLDETTLESGPAGENVRFKVELEQETDGRWIAEVPDLPGVLAYGADRSEAQAKVQPLALRVVAERLQHGEAGPELLDISFQAA
jgi:predicted RNase H-like HicB family nuclease